MSTDTSIEENLRHMLAVAGSDPAVPTDLMDQVKRGYSRRRGQRLAALTGAAVLLLFTGIGLTAHLGKPADDNGTTVVPRPTPSPTHVRYNFTETDWAAKAFRMPTTVAGHTFFPVGMLDSGHVLVATRDGSGLESMLVSFDIDTHATSVLTDLAVTGGLSDARPRSFFLSDNVVAWWATAKAPGGAAMAQFWAYDRTAGAKHVVATVPDTQIRNISVVDDQLFFVDRVAIYRLPLVGGGTPRLVVGTDSKSRLDGTWAYSVLTPGGIVAHGGADVLPTGTLLNVMTGERRTVTGPHGAGTFYCTASWCIGHIIRDNASLLFAMRVDGSDLRVFPASIIMADSMEPLPIGGHYQVFDYYNDGNPLVGLVDLDSGENGGLAFWARNADGTFDFGPHATDTPSMSDPWAISSATVAGADSVAFVPSANPAIVGWPTKSGDEIYVLPLS